MSDTAVTIKTFVDSSFGENAYVISVANDKGEPVGWVIDPSFSPQVDHLLEYVAEHNIKIEKIIFTHGHADHIAGLDVASAACPDAQVLLAAADQPMLSDANLNLSAPFGLSMTVQRQADGDLTPGEELELGSTKWQVLDTSGHSPGGRSLYSAQAGMLITGDALFAGSIGRVDFPGSNHRQLINNICENILTLPDETLIYSGHGPITSVGNERKSNPFLSE